MVRGLATTVAAVAVTAAIAIGTTALAHPPAKTSAVVAPVKLGLILDSAFAGFVKSVTGCTTSAVVSTVTSTNPPQKSLNGTQISACTIQHALMSTAYETWLKNQLAAGAPTTHTIDVAAFDGSGNVLSCVEVANASLTRFSTPALDATSSTAVYLTSTITGSSIKAASLASCNRSVTPASKNLAAANFSFVVGTKNDNPLRISAITVSRGTSGWAPSDFTVTTPYSGAGSTDYTSWYSSTVTHSPQATSERNAQLTLWGPTPTTTLFTLEIHNAGLDRNDAGTSATRSWGLYFEWLVPTF